MEPLTPKLFYQNAQTSKSDHLNIWATSEHKLLWADVGALRRPRRRAGQMLTVWACFLHNGLSFLEKNVWPCRLVEQTCGGNHTNYYDSHLLLIFFRSFRSCCHCEWNCFHMRGEVTSDLPRTQSRCHARWTLKPPGTCPPPRWGSHSRGSLSRTGCSSLSKQCVDKC